MTRAVVLVGDRWLTPDEWAELLLWERELLAMGFRAEWGAA